MDYVLTVTNGNCPNTLSDTFHVAVMALIIVDPGNDTLSCGEPALAITRKLKQEIVLFGRRDWD
jgi:hypothetical protein